MHEILMLYLETNKCFWNACWTFKNPAKSRSYFEKCIFHVYISQNVPLVIGELAVKALVDVKHLVAVILWLVIAVVFRVGLDINAINASYLFLRNQRFHYLSFLIRFTKIPAVAFLWHQISLHLLVLRSLSWNNAISF